MFQLLKDGRAAALHCDETESPAIHRAIADLRSDILKIGGDAPILKPLSPDEEDGCLVIGSLQNECFNEYIRSRSIMLPELEAQWERYAIVSFGSRQQNLLIAGSDERGAMWGIYELCERFLGVDPLYLWTDQTPEARTELAIPTVRMVSQPPTFKFRGWFLNDEDLLTEWLPGGGERHIDYPFYGQVVHPHVMEKVIETALRLKQNLLIPASFIDITNEAEEALVRQVTARGLFISQHHVEPMGVSHFGWDRYWSERKLDFPASYVRHPERFEEIWTYYAERWARYPNVIWQLGLRGRADKPVWVSDPAAPASMEERGGLISSALAKQHEIVAKMLGRRSFYSTATLWMEGTQLHHEGHLTFPEGTMPIFADYGPSQMLGADFYNSERKRSHSYGVYYHTAFWPCGPHLVQGNPPEKIDYNYKQIVQRGDTAYSILNVSNIREVVLGVRVVADLTWDAASFHKDRFMEEWCGRQFGAEHAQETLRLYSLLYKAYHEVKNDKIAGEVLMLDGVIKLLGLKLIRMEEDFTRKSWFEETYYAFDGYEAMIGFYTGAIGDSLQRWKRLYHEACALASKLPEARLSFFQHHFIVQIEAAIALQAWLHHLLLARAQWLQSGESQAYFQHIEHAVHVLERWIVERRKAEHGHWQDWYRGEKKLNASELLRQTRDLLRMQA